MKRAILLLIAGLLVGCGTSSPPATDPARKISWAEYQMMDAEQKDDPYVLDNLNDEAKKKLAEHQKKKKR